MKKIILLLGVLLMVNTSAMAYCECQCVPSYNMNNKFRTFMGRIGGVNFISEKAAQSAIKKAVTKNMTGENLNVELKSYSSKDLKNGIFKSLKVSGDNVVSNGIHLSHLDLSTVCDFNYVKHANGDVVFVEDLPMAFNLRMTSDDLNKTMQSEKYKKIIEEFNELGQSYGAGLRITSTKAAIKANKFYYIIGITLPIIRAEQKIVITSDLVVRDNKIDFKNTQLISDNFRMDMKKIDYVINYLNPLEFSVNLMDSKNADITVKNVKIQHNTILADGYVVIPKD